MPKFKSLMFNKDASRMAPDSVLLVKGPLTLWTSFYFQTLNQSQEQGTMIDLQSSAKFVGFL